MRFAHLGRPSDDTPRLAAVTGSGAVFLDEAMSDAPRDLQELVEGGPEALEAVRGAVDGRAGSDVAGLAHASAVLRPPAIIAVGANYRAHSSELDLPREDAPTVFSLWPSSLAGHGATTSWTTAVSTQVDYEAELGVIIGRPTRDVAPEDALAAVFGYTVVNDITARDAQFSESQWCRCKSFDGFTPTGPVVVTADEIPDPQALAIGTVLDGERMQDASTGDMVRGVAELVAYLSRGTTLAPGTLISTGSPGGAGYSRSPQVFLGDGSRVTVSIEGIGELTTRCRIT